MLQLHLTAFLLTCCALFCVTLYMSSGAWAKAWRKVIGGKLSPSETPVQMTSEKNVIADAFARIQREEDRLDEIADSISHNLSSIISSTIPPYRMQMPQVMVGRRDSTTSDMSQAYMQAIAKRRKTKKERDRHRQMEKTTSTGDLGNPYGVTTPLIQQTIGPNLAPGINKSLVNRANVIQPPFTHGMSGEARGYALNPFRPKVRRPPSGPNSMFTTAPMPYPAATLPFMPPMYPMMSPYTAFPMNPYSPYFMPPHMMAPPMVNEFVPFPDLDTLKSPLIPLRAHETGSEASFRMPEPSDTEYDTEAYRPSTAVPRDKQQPRSGRLSKRSGFFSS